MCHNKLLKIPINIPFVGKEEISVVTSILKNGSLTSSASQGGKYVQDFEKSVSSLIFGVYPTMLEWLEHGAYVMGEVIQNTLLL